MKSREQNGDYSLRRKSLNKYVPKLVVDNFVKNTVSKYGPIGLWWPPKVPGVEIMD
jgi:hypothetical protein